MNEISIASLTGTWRVVRSEIPDPYNREHEFFHFSPDGAFAWEYPFLEQKKRVFRFLYEVTETGIRFTSLSGKSPRDLPVRFDEGLLVITGPHGYSSWLQRIPAAERPPYLSEFYEPSHPEPAA